MEQIKEKKYQDTYSKFLQKKLFKSTLKNKKLQFSTTKTANELFPGTLQELESFFHGKK